MSMSHCTPIDVMCCAQRVKKKTHKNPMKQIQLVLQMWYIIQYIHFPCSIHISHVQQWGFHRKKRSVLLTITNENQEKQNHIQVVGTVGCWILHAYVYNMVNTHTLLTQKSDEYFEGEKPSFFHRQRTTNIRQAGRHSVCRMQFFSELVI